jgi:hypothetical protein
MTLQIKEKIGISSMDANRERVEADCFELPSCQDPRDRIFSCRGVLASARDSAQKKYQGQPQSSLPRLSD